MKIALIGYGKMGHIRGVLKNQLLTVNLLTLG